MGTSHSKYRSAYIALAAVLVIDYSVSMMSMPKQLNRSSRFLSDISLHYIVI